MSDEWRNGYGIEEIVSCSKKVNPRILDNIKNQVSNIIEDNAFILKICPRVAATVPVADTSCPFYIKAPLFRNCSLIANFFGPFTAREVAYMMGLTIDAVYHIEKSAMLKLRERFTTKDRKDLLP